MLSCPAGALFLRTGIRTFMGFPSGVPTGTLLLEELLLLSSLCQGCSHSEFSVCVELELQLKFLPPRLWEMASHYMILFCVKRKLSVWRFYLVDFRHSIFIFCEFSVIYKDVHMEGISHKMSGRQLPQENLQLASFICQVVSDSFGTPWIVGHQAPLSMGFSRQEYEWVATSFSRGSPWPRGR